MKVLCSLFDKVAQKFYAPSCFDNEACALRDAKALFVEHFGKRAKDYAVYHTGFFDVDSGEVASHTAPFPVILDGASINFEEVSNENI